MFVLTAAAAHGTKKAFSNIYHIISCCIVAPSGGYNMLLRLEESGFFFYSPQNLKNELKEAKITLNVLKNQEISEFIQMSNMSLS